MSMRYALTIVFALFPFLDAVTESAPLAASRLMVHIPRSLFREDGYNHKVALFGMPPYGGSIAQNVYYADQDMCNFNNVDATIGYPTRPYFKKKMEAWPSPYILMVDRGNCTFAHKVRNAQQSGAAGVVIADNICLCNDRACSQVNERCETMEPIMADDGSGSDISIPSFLMFKKDADAVKTELKANVPVQIEMTWGQPALDDRVQYELWTTPGDVISKDIIDNFGVVAEALGKQAHFTPHMFIYDGVKTHCHGWRGEMIACEGLCTNKGKYCATDPHLKGVSGADVVRESLRRFCIWSTYGAPDGIGSKWWAYVQQFNKHCNNKNGPSSFKDPVCVDNAMKKAKIDRQKVGHCMADSGDTKEDRANSYFELALTAQKVSGVVITPIAFVNSAPIRDALTVNNLFQSICTRFPLGKAPAICHTCSGCLDTANCIKKGWCSKEEGGSPGGVSIELYMFSILVAVSGFAWHHKKTHDEIRSLHARHTHSAEDRDITAYAPLMDDQDDSAVPTEEDQDDRMSGPAVDVAQGDQEAASLVD